MAKTKTDSNTIGESDFEGFQSSEEGDSSENSAEEEDNTEKQKSSYRHEHFIYWYYWLNSRTGQVSFCNKLSFK